MINVRLSPAGTALSKRGVPFLGAQEQLSFRPLPPAGEAVRIQDSEGNFLAWALSEGPGGRGLWVLSRERGVVLDQAWWQARAGDAAFKRQGLDVNASRRIIHGTADGMPGFQADWFGGQLFIRREPWVLALTLAWVEEALLAILRPSGIWRWEGQGPWQPSPFAPQGSPVLDLVEGPLQAKLDLSTLPASGLPPWPMERRAVRAWLRESAPAGAGFVFSPYVGEGAQGEDLFKRLDAIAPASQDYAFVDLPVSAKAAFGRFDAFKNGARLLQTLGKALKPGAPVLLSSAHSALAGKEAWQGLWAKAEMSGSLERVLGPELDLPGSLPAAFLFQT